MIGKYIKEKRGKSGLTQVQLAKKAGINATTISHIESGKTRPRVNTLRKVCEALKCNTPDIKGLQNGPTKEVGGYIKKERMKVGLDVKQVSSITGITVRTIHAIERGFSHTKERIDSLCKAIGIKEIKVKPKKSNGLGEKIKKQRMKKSLTQAELAEMAGCSTGTISLVERGYTNPSKRTRKGLCEALGIDLE